MDIRVDPREVLEHLHALGFSNITNEQLKEFIRDLKKLIKYDIRSCRCQNVAANEYSYVQNSSGTLPSVRSSYKESDTSKSNNSHILRENANNISKGTTSNEFYETSSSSSCSGESSSDNTSHSSDLLQRVSCSKPGKPKDDTQQKKLKSAFIRTWKLQKGAIPSGKAQRSDPVKLYHQYQSVWKKQKIPGESSHADLRWAVRERMLGENPNPRAAWQKYTELQVKFPCKPATCTKPEVKFKCKPSNDCSSRPFQCKITIKLSSL